jgi:hypothetical protein
MSDDRGTKPEGVVRGRQSGVDFMNPFLPYFTEKSNWDQFMLVKMTLCFM